MKVISMSMTFLNRTSTDLSMIITMMLSISTIHHMAMVDFSECMTIQCYILTTTLRSMSPNLHVSLRSPLLTPRNITMVPLFIISITTIITLMFHTLVGRRLTVAQQVSLLTLAQRKNRKTVPYAMLTAKRVTQE